MGVLTAPSEPSGPAVPQAVRAALPFGQGSFFQVQLYPLGVPEEPTLCESSQVRGPPDFSFSGAPGSPLAGGRLIPPRRGGTPSPAPPRNPPPGWPVAPCTDTPTPYVYARRRETGCIGLAEGDGMSRLPGYNIRWPVLDVSYATIRGVVGNGTARDGTGAFGASSVEAHRKLDGRANVDRRAAGAVPVTLPGRRHRCTSIGDCRGP